MFTAKILNRNFSLNSFKEVDSIDFIPGDQIKIGFQLWDPNEGLRYMPPTTAIISLIFNNTDGTTLTLAATMNTQDRSLGTVTMSAAQSQNIYGGNVFFQIDNLGDQTSIDDGIIYNCLRKITIDS